MSVEFIAATHARETLQRVQTGRARAIEQCGPAPEHESPAYWLKLFETNAAEVLAALGRVTLQAGFVVRYGYFGQDGRDFRVRPFVARASTDVSSVRRLLEWHPAPDSATADQRYAPNQDVELLYRHFHHDNSPEGFFDHWVAMQELWASARWTHSHVIASADELSQITSSTEWQVIHPVEAYQPAVVRSETGARLAVLLQSPLGRFQINLEQIDIGTDGSLLYADPVLVASGPRGYVS
jgi:hypothetical protein